MEVLQSRLSRCRSLFVFRVSNGDGEHTGFLFAKTKNRVKVIYLTMLFAMGTENFILAFSREPVVWCIGQIVGWFLVPVMSTNLEVLLRTSIPVELQGRVYACRNTLQFFTIPIGLFLGGVMVDRVSEPFMEA